MSKVVREGKETAHKVADAVRGVYGEETVVNVFKARKLPQGVPDFVMLFQAINLTLSKELKPASCKILLYFLGKAVYGNFIGVDIRTIMEELEFSSKTTVINSIKQLEQHHIIIKTVDMQDTRRNVYILNPHSAWKGTFKERFSTIKKLTEENQLRLPFKNTGE